MREDETHELLTEDEEIHFLELRKMKEFRKDSPVTWWLEFIKDPHSEVVEKIGEFEPVIREAVKMFDYVTSDPQMRELIRMREDGLHDYNSDINSAERRGRAEGKAEGREEEKREMVRQLLHNNVDINVIAISSGLSIDEIESLKAH
jgi:predicted transposase/invertase (TIGR01784 family)